MFNLKSMFSVFFALIMTIFLSASFLIADDTAPGVPVIGEVSQIMPAEPTTDAPTISGAFFLYDVVKSFCEKSIASIDTIKKNGMSAGGLLNLILFVIIPGLILLLRVLIFILRSIKIVTGPGGDAKIDKIIAKITPIQNFLLMLKERKKKT